MSIQVKFFASLREQLGKGDAQLDAVENMTADDVWQQVSEGQARDANVLIAINMDYVDGSAIVQDGDEVAFFPPVTGG